MTVPFERTRALMQTKDFLVALTDHKQTPRVPRWVRGKAKALLRHFPVLADIEMAHKALPEKFGSVDVTQLWDSFFKAGPPVSKDFER